MTAAPITVADVLPGPTPAEHGRSAGRGPLVTVVVPLNFPDMGVEERDLVLKFTRSALATLSDLGADLDVIDISLDEPVSIRQDTDGVMLLGGGDVDPSLYGYTAPVPNLYGVDRRTDERTLAALDLGLGLDAPVLGICRGSQMINLAFGGTLVPDLGADNPHRGAEGEPMFIDDPVTVEENSRLHTILSKTDVVVRNGHHQAVGQVGHGLRVTARGIDGVVEGVEHESMWIVGVQWHPEDTDGSAEDRMALFRAFVERATAHARTRSEPAAAERGGTHL